MKDNVNKGTDKIDLDLGSSGGDADFDAAGARKTQPAAEMPIAGWSAVGLGLLGIFVSGKLFIPFGIIATVIAFVQGQTGWAWGGVILNGIAILTSPGFWLMLGLAGAAAMFGT